MDHCQECGATAYKHELIPTDVGPIHRGECHMRFLVHLETVDMTRRLWAALSLWDMRKPVHVKVEMTKPGNVMKVNVTGVIFDHHPSDDVWFLEDKNGKVHEFSTTEKMEVLEDEYAA